MSFWKYTFGKIDKHRFQKQGRESKWPYEKEIVLFQNEVESCHVVLAPNDCQRICKEKWFPKIQTSKLNIDYSIKTPTQCNAIQNISDTFVAKISEVLGQGVPIDQVTCGAM